MSLKFWELLFLEHLMFFPPEDRKTQGDVLNSTKAH